MTVLGHERQLTFFPLNGHNHDGENSSPVELLPGQVGLRHLDPALLEYLTGDDSGDNDSAVDGFVPVPDLLLETNSIGAGASVTGSIDWTGICVVRFMRIYMSAETECTLTFYHTSTFADEDREFRAYRCANKFLWEGPWVHYDESETKKIHYKIENTGTTAARFQVVLKSGTLVANAYARFVESMQVMGSAVAGFMGNVLLEAGNGVTITPSTNSNSFRFDAVAPQTIIIDRYGLYPRKHTSYTSSATVTVTGSGINSVWGTSNYIQFGSGSQSITFDYGTTYTVGRVQIVPYPDSRVSINPKIESSFDGINWTILLQASGTAAMATQSGMMVEIPSGMFMRYIRYSQNGTSNDTGNYLTGAVIYAQTNKVGS